MRCQQCNKKAIIFRPYEGRALCSQHFIISIEQKVSKAVAKNKMIVKGDKVLIALSGSPSSLVLAAILKKIYGKRPDIKLFAASINDGKTDAISSNISKIGIPHRFLSLKKIFRKKIMDHNEYTIARRWILNKEAKEMGATKIAVDQTLDEEAQSVLMNFLRGDIARLARLGPITNFSTKKTKNKIFIPRIKPFRVIPKSEIELYARLNRFCTKSLRHDDTVRDEVAAFLNKMERLHPGISFTIVETADKLLPAIQEIAEQHEGPIIRCKKCGEPGSQSPCRTCQILRK